MLESNIKRRPVTNISWKVVPGQVRLLTARTHTTYTEHTKQNAVQTQTTILMLVTQIPLYMILFTHTHKQQSNIFSAQTMRLQILLQTTDLLHLKTRQG